jgi:co-chaperonin GroES (HSP10)
MCNIQQQAKEKPTEGEVVAAGPGRLHPETAVLMPMCVKPGAFVRAYDPTCLPWFQYV